MKNLKILLPVLFIISGIFIVGCGDTDRQHENSGMEMYGDNSETHEQMESGHNENFDTHNEVVKISLPTIQCDICKKKITTAVTGVDGVENVNVSVSDKNVSVSYDKDKTNLSLIENAITAAGYGANDKKADPIAYEKLDDCCKVPDKKSY